MKESTQNLTQESLSILIAEKPQYVKVLKKSLIHNNFLYKEGLNIDYIPFNPNGECSPGGLYFCKKENLYLYTSFGSLVADVEIPSDAQVYHESNKLKADKIIISNIRPLSKFDLWQDDKFCLDAVKHNGCNLRHIENQTPEICFAAINQYSYSLKYVKNQTDEICLAAIKKNGMLLKYVKNQTDEICIAAVRENGYALYYVKNQTDEICIAAVANCGNVLSHVKNQTDAICLAAVYQNKSVLCLVNNQTPEICLAANKLIN